MSTFAPALDQAPADYGILPNLRIAILLCPSFTLNSMASFVDTLRLAADREDRSRQHYFAWDFISLDSKPLRASCGLEVTTTATLNDLARYDAVAVCGGLLPGLADIHPEAFAHLRAAAMRSQRIIGLCTGSFVMARAGLLEGRRAAVHFDMLGAFVQNFPNVHAVTNENFVVDGNMVTSPGSLTSIEVAAYLVARYGDQGRARKAINYLLFKPAEALRLDSPPYAEALTHASQLTLEAVRAMEFRLDTPTSIDSLARSLNTSRARLHRAFERDLKTTPSAFWRKIRLFAARQQLQGRRRTITEIAYDMGFCDTAHFCHVFKKQFGLTPHEYREREEHQTRELSL